MVHFFGLGLCAVPVSVLDASCQHLSLVDIGRLSSF